MAYRFPAVTLLQQHKFAGKLSLTATLTELLLKNAPQPPDADLIIPMPLHPTRLRERGYNQAAEIARLVARQTGIALSLNGCVRTRATRPQSDLSLEQRRSNLRGAFSCTQALTGKRVLLIDDVMTTGASLDALAKTVKKSGAASVSCWVVARTLRE